MIMMKRVLSTASALAVLALATPCLASTIAAPYGSGTITLDGKNPIAVGLTVTAQQYSWGMWVNGNVNIMAYAGPFKGVALGRAASVETKTLPDGTVQSVVHTGPFWYSDLTNWVPGYSSGIKYCWALADVTVLKGKTNSVGFTIYRADNGAVIASVPPMPVITGAVPIK
jgi:hypothetical protein